MSERRRVVITGVSRGIGRALTDLFSAAGHEVLALSRAEDASMRSRMRVHYMAARWDDMDEVVSGIMGWCGSGGVDVLINNAGALVNRPVTETTDEDLREMMEVNAFLPYRLIRGLYVAGGFAAGAHVVNISSMGGYQGSVKYPGLSAYSMSKAAVVAMTECMSEEFAGSVQVNCLCLGAVNTEMLAAAFPGYHAPTEALEAAAYIRDFALHGGQVMSGSVIPVKKNNP